MKNALSFLALLAFGCGASTPAPDTNDGDGTGAAEDCPYSVEDGCIDEDALAECRQAAEQCPGAVLVMESCPLQFGCE